MKILKVVRLSYYWQKSIGLIGSTYAHPVYFQTRYGVHTLFLKFPISVVILDNSFSIVALKKYMAPNTIYFWNPRYKHVLELPTNMGRDLKIGLKIKLVLTSA